MTREHHYRVELEWTGNNGSGTGGYRAYSRDHVISSSGKPPVPGSADSAFLGEASRWNPEELLVASVSACHQLWYLHLCADAGVVVEGYRDCAEGLMAEERGGAGRFRSVMLRPRVEIGKGADAMLAERLHSDAHSMCFIARSVNFEIGVHPTIIVLEADAAGPERRQQAAGEKLPAPNR